MSPRHTLVLLRHAKSDWSGDERDVDRPLTKRGRRQAAEAGAWLAAHAAPLDLAVVSTARRAAQTWELVRESLPRQPEVHLDERVYGASSAGLLRVVRELPEKARTALLVGHNPGLEDLLATLTGAWRPLRTAEIAVVDLDVGWSSAGRGATLRTLGRPPGPATDV